nr:hypothetical protein [Providencia sp. G1(2023)]
MNNAKILPIKAIPAEAIGMPNPAPIAPAAKPVNRAPSLLPPLFPAHSVSAVATPAGQEALAGYARVLNNPYNIVPSIIIATNAPAIIG